MHNCYPSHGSVVVVDWVDWTIFEKEEVKKSFGKVAGHGHLLMTDVVDLFKAGVTLLFSNSAHCIAGRVKVSGGFLILVIMWKPEGVISS